MSKQIIKISFQEAGSKGVNIGYKNFDENGFVGSTNKDYKKVPHNDFIQALQGFRWHLLFLTEFRKAADFSRFPTVDADDTFRVCGVVLTGSEEKQGFMITGYKTLSNGKGFAFNSPNLRESEEYDFMEELTAAWTNLKNEAGAYLGGKYAVVQKELEFDADQSNAGPTPVYPDSERAAG